MNKKTESTATRIQSFPARWQRLKHILAEALEQASPKERSAVLRESCADDTELLREAEKLLAHDHGFRGIRGVRSDAPQARRTRSNWRANRRVPGLSGNLGAVAWERCILPSAPMDILRSASRSKSLNEVLIPMRCCAGFGSNGKFSANLEHPNITRLLDAGTTNDGLPYFVMELIQGTPITHFVQRENVQYCPRAARALSQGLFCSAARAPKPDYSP